MNNTIERVTMLSVSIIMLGIVIGVVFFGLNQSRDFFGMGMDTIDNTSSTSQKALITELKEAENGIPTSACYVLLKHYPDLCSSCTCTICGATSAGASAGDCLRNHMKGRVKLNITEDVNGGYNITIVR